MLRTDLSGVWKMARRKAYRGSFSTAPCALGHLSFSLSLSVSFSLTLSEFRYWYILLQRKKEEKC